MYILLMMHMFKSITSINIMMAWILHGRCINTIVEKLYIFQKFLSEVALYIYKNSRSINTSKRSTPVICISTYRLLVALWHLQNYFGYIPNYHLYIYRHIRVICMYLYICIYLHIYLLTATSYPWNHLLRHRHEQTEQMWLTSTT